MGKQQQARNPTQCGVQSQSSQGMRSILATCRDSNDIIRVSNLFKNMGVEISKADFTIEFDKINSMMQKGDLQLGTGGKETAGIINNVKKQKENLQSRKQELLKKIRSSEASSEAEEVRFLDLRKEAGEVQKFSNILTTQDYTIAVLMCGYILLSLAAYWRLCYEKQEISLKVTGIFLSGWLISTAIFISLFNTFA
jgi:hypothetical protein